MSRSLAIALVFTTLPLAACTTLSGDPAGVAQARSAYFAAWTKNEGETFTTDRLSKVILTTPEFYSIDGMAPTPTIQGWDAYQATWATGMNQFKSAQLVEVSTPNTWNSHDLAATTSECRVTGTMPDGTTLDIPARVTLVFRKVHGQWRIVHENMNVPPKQ